MLLYVFFHITGFWPGKEDENKTNAKSDRIKFFMILVFDEFKGLAKEVVFSCVVRCALCVVRCHC